MGQIQFSIKHARTENYRVYYRVFADGVELPSMVCIFTSQKSKDSDEELKKWCRDNAWRLENSVKRCMMRLFVSIVMLITFRAIS
jgi:hypothetical protein